MSLRTEEPVPPLGWWRLAPLAIWAVHATLASAAVNGNCHLAVLHHDALAGGSLRALLYILTAVGAAVALAVAGVSYRSWRAPGRDRNGRIAFGAGWTGAIALASLVYLGWSLVAIASLSPC
jgi:hypothetical protein